MTAAPIPDNSQQRIADLRSALQEAACWLAYAAGREAATNPDQAGWLLAASKQAKDVLARHEDGLRG